MLYIFRVTVHKCTAISLSSLAKTGAFGFVCLVS